MKTDLIRKLADKAVEREMRQAESLIPPSVMALLRRAFTVRALPFFEFYGLLKQIEIGLPVPDDIFQQYRRTTHILAQVRSPVDRQGLSPTVVNQLATTLPLMRLYFTRLLNGTEDPLIWARINDVLVPLIVEVAKDKGIYLRALQRGRDRWATFRRMSDKQERVEKLRDDDPESYAMHIRLGKTIEEIDAGIRDAIAKAGMVERRTFMMGRPVYLGVDPGTGEESLFDRDGEILVDQGYGEDKISARQQFIEKRKAQEEQKLQLATVATRTEVKPNEIRKLSDPELERLQGSLQWDALTDDMAKQGRLTRIFPTKEYPVWVADEEGGVAKKTFKVVAEGRYKGIFLDDLVNSQGRLIEGTAFTYNVKTGRAGGMPLRIDPSEREPYVTVAEVGGDKGKERKLFLKVPGGRAHTALRNAMKTLASNVGNKAGSVASILYHAIDGSQAAGFYFDAKDFGLIRDTVKGLSLSTEALHTIKSYYRELANAEMATAPDNLGYYSAKELGGFVTSKKNPSTGEIETFDLLIKQKQALAWLDANGNRGVCALGTGIGKTLQSIAMMLKLSRDGFTEEGATYTDDKGKQVKTNGRFLYVCPTALKGNLPKEIRQFVSDDKSLRERVDVISYREFAAAGSSGKVPNSIRSVPHWKNKTWNTKEYVAIFFDEAHEMKNPNSGRAQAAMNTWHPRKILLTASPMEKDPMEAYVLAAIANNWPLRGPEGAENRANMRRFKERFCETVGGRIVGVVDDPMVKRDLMVWVKRNIFYADKTDVEEVVLPSLRAETLTVDMPEEVEQVYRVVTDRFAKTMQGLVSKYRDKGKQRVVDPNTGEVKTLVNPDARDPRLERIFSKAFAPVLKLMNDLANMPGVAFENIADMMETGTLPDGKPLSRNMVIMLNIFRSMFNAEELRAKAATLPNPKLEAASNGIMSKLAASEGESRTLLFSDDKRFCLEAAKHLSNTIPGKHVLALGDKIYIFASGAEISEYKVEMDGAVVAKLATPEEQERLLAESGGVVAFPVPFYKKSYKRYPALPAHPKWNPNYRADNWQTFVLREIVTPDPTIKTCTLLGQVYQTGQNLQAFDTVIHLDRDTWNSEDMNQRTARAWRQGQDKPVDEITLDMVYPESKDGAPRDDLDRTLDEIRRYLQQMDSDLFDAIIRDAQGTELGREWAEIKKRDASNLRLDRKLMEMLLSPYVSRSTPPGSR